MKNINNESSLQKAERIAISYISYKSRTEKEVCDKLRSCGEFEEAVISETIGFLKSCGYIDDMKYAEAFARLKADKKLDGAQKIKYMLIQRGIAKKTAEAAIAALNDPDGYGEYDEAEAALKLIQKKLRGKEIDYAEKKRLFDYLKRKGYSYCAINEAFGKLETEWDSICILDEG